MNLLTKVVKAFIKDGYQMIKILRLGSRDVQEINQAAPHGVDSAPVPDMVAVYSETLSKGEPVIIGYIKREQLSIPGETRIYSTDKDGEAAAHIWLRNNGNIELGGDTDNAVRYIPLNDALQQLVQFINQQLPLIASGISTGGGSYAPGTATLDISDAKIDEIKTL